jgi:Family of unknown function (DUF6166)
MLNTEPRVYEGLRHPDEADTGGESIVLVNGSPLSLSASLKVRNHSPTGFSWGYGGSGPAQLALAILLDYFQNDAPRARHYYQNFKWQFVAKWPGGGNWKITSAEIESWLAAQPAWEPDNFAEWGAEK